MSEGNYVPAATTSQGPACRDCGAKIVGRFCHRCGQRVELRSSVKAIVYEALSALVDVDRRAGRTFRALIRSPGKLTQEYIDGRRTRYLSPIHLFLATTTATVATDLLVAKLGSPEEEKEDFVFLSILSWIEDNAQIIGILPLWLVVLLFFRKVVENPGYVSCVITLIFWSLMNLIYIPAILVDELGSSLVFFALLPASIACLSAQLRAVAGYGARGAIWRAVGMIALSFIVYMLPLIIEIALRYWR